MGAWVGKKPTFSHDRGCGGQIQFMTKGKNFVILFLKKEGKRKKEEHKRRGARKIERN